MRQTVKPYKLLSGLLLGAVFYFGSQISFAETDAQLTTQTLQEKAPDIEQVCLLLEDSATIHQLPPGFFARLIWKESRFDHLAVSPVGAQGIAQFMPATARERGLADPFDYSQAIPASAALLADLKREFGNWGLAAAAYNAGSGRVRGWLNRGGFLPLEAESYVLDITGTYADDFIGAPSKEMQPLDKELDFLSACKRLPIIATRMIAQARIKPQPWGIQVAGNFKRAVAVAQWGRLRKHYKNIIGSKEPHISRQRSAMGRRGIYAVRIGADSRAEADNICNKLRDSGGGCIVTRNR
ncbi:transglycosylase SLT domain-containing protein [Paenochrobactrum pullorum]|uniref:transglycosylase SLT domain-containing protein n=1 Tax=Paenochrobactrum pullorum TaxID=1324351 RepID=UPI0035BBAF34